MIAGTALGVMNGGLGGILGGLGVPHQGCSENTPVNRYELGQEQTIARLQADVALRDANIYNDQKLLEVYKYFDVQVKDIRATMCENDKALAVSNAKIEGTFAVLGEQIREQRNEFTFYPKLVADITTGTTVTAQPTYNPVYNCGCCK